MRKGNRTRNKKGGQLTVNTKVFSHKMSFEGSSRLWNANTESNKSRNAKGLFSNFEERFSPKNARDHPGASSRVKKSRLKYLGASNYAQNHLYKKSPDRSLERKRLPGKQARGQKQNKSPRKQKQSRGIGSDRKDRAERAQNRQKSNTSKSQKKPVSRVQEITKNLKRIKKRLIMKRLGNNDKSNFRKSSPSKSKASREKAAPDGFEQSQQGFKRFLHTEPGDYGSGAMIGGEVFGISGGQILGGNRAKIGRKDGSGGSYASGGIRIRMRKEPAGKKRVGSSGKVGGVAGDGGRKKVGKRRRRGNGGGYKQRVNTSSKPKIHNFCIDF